jgi:hypothetical protein
MDADQRPERRRSERISSRTPIPLALKYQDWEFQQSACAVDVSSGGLRIRTEPALNEGHGISFFSDEGVLHPGYCRVAWVRVEGSDGPCEAGLELLPQLASRDQSWNETQ